MRISEQIRHARAQWGWTQAELAKRLRVPASTIQRCERASYNSMSLRTIQRFANVLRVSFVVVPRKRKDRT